MLGKHSWHFRFWHNLQLLMAMSWLMTAELSAADTEVYGFEMGDSCELMADQTKTDIRQLIFEASPEDLGHFCMPEWPNTCIDYNALVEGVGSLKFSKDGYFCALEGGE